MKKTWKNFISTERIFDDAEDVSYADEMKHKTGSTKDVVSPLKVMLERVRRNIARAEINKIKLRVAQHIRCGGLGKWVMESDHKNGNEPSAAFYQNGKEKYLLTTKDVADVLNNLTGDKTQGDVISAALIAATSFARAKQTTESLDFAVSNPLRDTQEALLYSKQAGVTYKKIKMILDLMKLPFTFAKNLVGAIGYKLGATKIPRLQDDPKYWEWVGTGGSQATMVSQDINRIQNYYDDLSKTFWEKIIGTSDENKIKRIAYALPRVLKQTLRAMQEFSELSENTTRLQVFKTAHDAFAEQRTDKKATQADLNRAALASRDSIIDFARAGSATRKANRYIAFLNAGVQSLDKNYRLIKDVATSEDKVTAMQDLAFKLILTSVVPAIAQSAALSIWGDDDDKKYYESSVNNWKKNANWIFHVGDKWITIPKSYDLITRLVSTVSEQLFSPVSVDTRRYGQVIKDANVISIDKLLPSVLVPFWEVHAGFSSFYGGPIVPQKEMNLLPEERYGKNTSYLAKKLAGMPPMNLLGWLLKPKGEELSPRELDHIVSGEAGFIGKLFSGAYGTELSEFPVTKRFFFEPLKNPQIVQDYYDIRSDLREKVNTHKLHMKSGKEGILTEQDKRLWQKFKSSENAMKKLAEREKKIMLDEKIPKSEVERQRKEILNKQIEIAKKVLGR